MKSSKLPLVSFLFVIGIVSLVATPQAWSRNLRPAQLTAHVIQRPDPMVAYGKAYLVYELLLTNYDAAEVDVRSLRITDPDNKDVRFDFSGKALRDMMAPVGKANKDLNPATIKSGASRLVFVWLKFTSAAAVPHDLAQSIGYRVKRDTVTGGEITLPPTAVDDAPPLTIGPPLEGGDWIAEGAPSNTSYHRRAHMVFDGAVKFAQRFAIDYEKIGPDGTTYSGNESKNRSYYCYGAKVIAVANGRVVAVHDGVPENVPHSGKRPVEMNTETAGGNYVAIDIGYGRYALYGHLIPGSIKVKPGEVVKRGQVLALLGNSGNSTEPHLHFQIADAPSFLDANGLPYMYDRVGVMPSHVVNPNVDPPVVRITGPVHEYYSTMLLENQVVVFPK